jgi:hypothetical protein
MHAFRWINFRALHDRRQHVARRKETLLRDDTPSDPIVQHLFVQISHGGPIERKAWIELARYLGCQNSARRLDLMHLSGLRFIFSVTNLR